MMMLLAAIFERETKTFKLSDEDRQRLDCELIVAHGQVEHVTACHTNCSQDSKSMILMIEES
jgi:hypothetical protein